MRKKILVTHNDKDAMGCAVLFTYVYQDTFGGVEIHYCNNPKEASKVVNNILRDNIEFDLYIADMSVTEEVAQHIDCREDVSCVLLDHHETALELNKYDWATVEEGKCGAKLLYEYLILFGYNTVKRYEDFIKLVNDYDLYIHQYPESKDLNILLGIIGRVDFIERFLIDPDTKLSDIEEYIVNMEKERRGRYIDSKLRNLVIKNNYAFVFAEDYINDLADVIKEEHDKVDIVFIIDMSKNKVSLRSRKGVSCSTIAKFYGGGGHPQASGFIFENIIADNTMSEILGRF